MAALSRPPTAGLLLLLLPLIALGFHYGYEAYLADACLEQGGSFDYENWTCSVTESYEFSPYLDRHWGKAVVALSLSLSGLIVIVLNHLKKR